MLKKKGGGEVEGRGGREARCITVLPHESIYWKCRISTFPKQRYRDEIVKVMGVGWGGGAEEEENKKNKEQEHKGMILLNPFNF